MDNEREMVRGRGEEKLPNNFLLKITDSCYLSELDIRHYKELFLRPSERQGEQEFQFELWLQLSGFMHAS